MISICSVDKNNFEFWVHFQSALTCIETSPPKPRIHHNHTKENSRRTGPKTIEVVTTHIGSSESSSDWSHSLMNASLLHMISPGWMWVIIINQTWILRNFCLKVLLNWEKINLSDDYIFSKILKPKIVVLGMSLWKNRKP